MRYADYTMGTIVSFDLRTGSCTHAQASRALRRACARLHRADEVFSTWKPDSPMSRLRRGEITLAQAPPEVAEVLWRCADARRLSDGWFDPWATPGGVDPAGLVRGWAVTGALEILRSAGITAALIDAGGVVAAFGTPQPARPWRIPVPGAGSPGPAAGLVEGAGAVATVAAGGRGAPMSGPDGWTRGLRDGRGPAPTLRLRSGTVTGPDLAIAEALAAALLAAGADGPALVDRVPGYSAMTVDAEGTVETTAGFPGAAAARPPRVGAAA